MTWSAQNGEHWEILKIIDLYREYNSNEDKFQVMVVPKSRRNRSLDYETSDDQENSNRLQRQRVNAG